MDAFNRNRKDQKGPKTKDEDYRVAGTTCAPARYCLYAGIVLFLIGFFFENKNNTVVAVSWIAAFVCFGLYWVLAYLHKKKRNQGE